MCGGKAILTEQLGQGVGGFTQHSVQPLAHFLFDVFIAQGLGASLDGWPKES